ncbi:flagellar hook-basal body complex protein FliE [Thalassotalea marina]|uniref:Flagellar hook-basal body complex protein FliE n=1 Tax=Thalassotalea marina TaxID=1673741 RepID=A0A919EGN8_9GAMM|nr:flagellar hook-basal body complex protein FliE [Thalassotalea marina]GHF80584.1 flagellar hook-basal body complex protein FliE [Thalassotalea marina]
MDIKSNSLYAQMQSMQLEAMGNRMTTNNNVEAISETANTSGSDFGTLLKNAVNTVNDLQKETGELRNRFEMGDRSVSLSDTMIASAKSGIAFEATVQVRNKFVEAYKEIMSMPV